MKSSLLSFLIQENVKELNDCVFEQFPDELQKEKESELLPLTRQRSVSLKK